MATNEFILQQIEDTKTIITNVTAAINALLVSDHASYELDTGQTRQRVTRLNLDDLRRMRKNLYSELQSLEILAGVTPSTITVQPGF